MLEIIYQDEWLVAVNKPSGWLVHRSWLDRDEKVVVMQTVRDQIGQHVFTAHRLDRPTSGVLLMGLSSEAGRRLSQQFEQHQMQKRYHAVVRGWLTDEAVLDYPLVESWIRSLINLPATIKSPSRRSRTIAEWRPSKCRWRPDVIRQRATAWLSWSPKPGVNTSCVAIFRIYVTRLSATVNMAISDKTVAPQSIFPLTA